jgi:hypothetical protein
MTFDEQLRRAFETLNDRLQDDIRREVQIAVDEAVAAKSAAETARAAAETARALDAADKDSRLLDSVQWLGRARSLGETLDILASAAAREAPRVAVLTIRGGRAHGRRFIGFGALDEAPPINLVFDDAGIIATAARDNAVAVGQPAPAFASLEPGVPSMAVPLALAGEVVAILYADAGIPNPESPNPESRLHAGALEILARFAARGIEAMTAFKVARSLTVPTPSPEPPAPPADKNDEEDVAGARRYARLLVSEIKLYHEDSIAAGRRDRDLGSRLGGEIARARVLYEQRVPPHVRARAPYFDDEIVRTLANGDASLLGART